MKKATKTMPVNYVNFVNYLTPYCICFVKNGQKCSFSEKTKEFTKQMRYPYMKFTKFTKFTLLKNAVFGGILTVFCTIVLFIDHFPLKKSSLNEYMLTIRWYKELLQRVVNKDSVNLRELALFEVHTKVHTDNMSVNGGGK